MKNDQTHNVSLPSASQGQAEPESLGEFNGHEIYPMPMFAKLAVPDVDALAACYQQALGFAIVFRAPSIHGQLVMIHLRRHKYQDLLLVPAHTPSSPSSAVWLTFGADGEVDALAERARKSPSIGASQINGPINTPWNTRDLTVIDPAGNQLVFTGRNPNPDPDQAARLQAMLDSNPMTKMKIPSETTSRSP
jgi:uncharacterized glyoxalase superfamily protein PhnB